MNAGIEEAGLKIAALFDALADKRKPTDEEALAAATGAVGLITIAVDSLARLAMAAERIAAVGTILAECVDDNCQPALVVKALVEPPEPAAD